LSLEQQMRRREFITMLGGAAAWPLAARAQQPAMPVIGFLSARSPYGSVPHVAAFRQGLAEAGFVEDRNLRIEFRWAHGQYDQLPILAVDLVDRQVAVIAAVTPPAALAAKAATKTIPIVFTTMLDPAKAGLVESLNRPGGNATGAYTLATSLEGKRLELLHEVIPKVARIAVLVNPHFWGTELELKDLHEAARILGLELLVLEASSEGGITAAFATIVEQRIGALLVASDPFFLDQREQLVALTARHAIPAIFFFPEFALAGGLMAYGTRLVDTYRLAATYTGRILKGAKPADLPIQQSTKIELIINLKTAQALGLTFPVTLLADEVIQ
jgi:putative ABC transport system substrate-binding protein